MVVMRLWTEDSIRILVAVYVVVMFWASTCDHCQQMVPRLHEWYLHENSIDLEFITISIDTTLKQFDAFIKELKPEWITAHDPLGWNGFVPEKYFIYATPSLFLLDHDRKIIAQCIQLQEYLGAWHDTVTHRQLLQALADSLDPIHYPRAADAVDILDTAIREEQDWVLAEVKTMLQQDTLLAFTPVTERM